VAQPRPSINQPQPESDQPSILTGQEGWLAPATPENQVPLKAARILFELIDQSSPSLLSLF